MAEYFGNDIWLLKVCYMADIFERLNELNLSLQGENFNVINLVCKIKGFIIKIGLWKLSIEKNKIEIFPWTNEFIVENHLNVSEIKIIILNHLSELESQFAKYFSADINAENYNWIQQPFLCDIASLQHLNTKAQHEFAELSTDSTLKLAFTTQTLGNFWMSVKNEFPLLTDLAVEILLSFATTYLCECAFSTLLYIKSKYRTQLALRPALSKIEPRLTLLCKNKQAHPSH